MRPTLLAISSAYPELALTQDEMWEGLLKHWYRNVPNAERAIRQTRVRKRHMAWDPRKELFDRSPLTGDRVEVFEKAVLDVAGRSVEAVLGQVDNAKVGSFAMACSTGYMGPTPDLLMAKRFGLRSSLRRTFVGHMGCFAAFNVLKVAMDSLAARPDEHVLVNCTEFSSLHFRPDPTAEQAVVHGLFGDATVSLVMGSAPEGTGMQFLRSHTEQLYHTHELMTLKVKNDGFAMSLSPFVPFVLAEHIDVYLERLLGPEGLTAKDITRWIIHPGGPKILEMLAKQLGLTREDMRASWHVLEEYGNCASGTVLLVLEDMLKKDAPKRGEYGVMMSFGPGLTMEGALLRF